MKHVSLYYLTPNTYGGWVTFSAHLWHSFLSVGVEPKLYKIIQDRPDRKTRPKSERYANKDFGYGLKYRNITIADALKGEEPKLILAAGKRFKEETAALINAGSFIVLHDPTELKNLPDLPGDRTFVGRRANLIYAPEATFIRHPFGRLWNGPFPEKTVHAVSTARLDFDKHTDIIVDANFELPEELKITIRGTENRVYEKWKLMQKYPWWRPLQGKYRFPRTMDAALNILLPARYSVDMSEIKGDGGGTQSSFLEAWDAGAVPVINKAWVHNFPDDDMQPGKNCLAVENPEELVALLKKDPATMNLDKIQVAGVEQLKLHAHNVIGEQYAKELRCV